MVGWLLVVEVLLVVELLMAASSEPWGLSLLLCQESQGSPLGRGEDGGVTGMSRRREVRWVWRWRVRRRWLLLLLLLRRVGMMR